MTSSLILWLEAHEKLAGWAQFFGAIAALAVTYFTAFWPVWRRKRQLNEASMRLLLHGYEVLESFHRTSGFFRPQAINLKAATISIRFVINEMNKFPIYDLDDQGQNSKARRIIAISATLEGTCLFLDSLIEKLGDEEMLEDDRTAMRNWIEDRLKTIVDLISGKVLERPKPSDFATDVTA